MKGAFPLFFQTTGAMGTSEASILTAISVGSLLVHPDMLPGQDFEVSGYYVGAQPATVRIRFTDVDADRAGITGALMLSIPITANQGAFSGRTQWKPLTQGYLKVTGQIASAAGGCIASGLLVAWYDKAPLSQLSQPPIDQPQEVHSGQDIDGIVDVGKSFAIASGLRNIGNAMARRLMTPRGGLFYDPNYGLDLRNYLSAGNTPQQLAQLQSEIVSEVSKDERIENPTVTVAINVPASKLTIAILTDTAVGPYKFIVEIGKLSVDLLRIEAVS